LQRNPLGYYTRLAKVMIDISIVEGKKRFLLDHLLQSENLPEKAVVCVLSHPVALAVIFLTVLPAVPSRCLPRGFPESCGSD